MNYDDVKKALIARQVENLDTDTDRRQNSSVRYQKGNARIVVPKNKRTAVVYIQDRIPGMQGREFWSTQKDFGKFNAYYTREEEANPRSGVFTEKKGLGKEYPIVKLSFNSSDQLNRLFRVYFESPASSGKASDSALANMKPGVERGEGSTAKSLRELNTASVIRAIDEFKRVGRSNFLQKYGFGKAREYFIYYGGKYYDSKAIVGAASAHYPGSPGPLLAKDFSGGEATVQRTLEKLGFTVVRLKGGPVSESSPLVLVENEATFDSAYDFWEDDTGVRYHYPNQYVNRIRPGRPFIYYKGVRRTGGKRGAAEYFGTGIIGEVWRDPAVPVSAPKRDWRWYCAIEEYEPFLTAVRAKNDQGAPYEDISSSMGWRTGVREISWEVFDAILEAAHKVQARDPLAREPLQKAAPSTADDLEEMLIARAKGTGGSGGREGQRRSPDAKKIGDRAEEIIYNWLRESLAPQLIEGIEWIAQQGQKPGWDIQYRSEEGELIAVEVKGTTLARFPSIELTANEWGAAETLGARYHLALVSRVNAASPKIFMFENLHARVSSGALSIAPTLWRLTHEADG